MPAAPSIFEPPPPKPPVANSSRRKSEPAAETGPVDTAATEIEAATESEPEQTPIEASEDVEQVADSPPNAAPAEPKSDPAPETEAEAKSDASTDDKPAEPSNRIELIIDSLSNHILTEPIPVTIDPLGDSVFTASVRNLEMSATGNSIGEALLVLKEQIEHVYDDLNKRNQSQLSTEQKTTLQMLHTYIAPTPPPSKRSQWY